MVSTGAAVTGHVNLERAERIIVRISAEEKRKFEKVAKKRFTNLSELVRRLLHEEAEKAA